MFVKSKCQLSLAQLPPALACSSGLAHTEGPSSAPAVAGMGSQCSTLRSTAPATLRRGPRLRPPAAALAEEGVVAAGTNRGRQVQQ